MVLSFFLSSYVGVPAYCFSCWTSMGELQHYTSSPQGITGLKTVEARAWLWPRMFVSYFIGTPLKWSQTDYYVKFSLFLLNSVISDFCQLCCFEDVKSTESCYALPDLPSCTEL